MALTLSGTNGVVGAGFTVDASGVSVTAGVGTFSSLQGSGANLTALPAANLTGALPAISAASCTSIPAANIVGLATAGFERSGGFPQGITEADIWRIDTEFDQQSQADITSNWARATWGSGSLHGYKGTGMTESSGIFTFPSTGYWYIDARLGYHSRTGVSSGIGLEILGTSNNSSYFNLASAWDTAPMSSGYYEWGHMNCSTIIDVTSTTNCKVKFRTEAANNPVKFYSTAGGHNNNFIFLRIGDT